MNKEHKQPKGFWRSWTRLRERFTGVRMFDNSSPRKRHRRRVHPNAPCPCGAITETRVAHNEKHRRPTKFKACCMLRTMSTGTRKYRRLIRKQRAARA